MKGDFLLKQLDMFFHARVIQELGLSATSQLPSLVLCQFFPQSEQQLRISTTGILDAILIEKKQF